MLLPFFKNKKILITGHTGFKGSRLCAVLCHAGARVSGYALPPADGSLFTSAAIGERLEHNIYADIRDFDALYNAVKIIQPEIIIHLAAQPIVSRGYAEPYDTYTVNVLGTLNLLECVRRLGGVRSLLNVTTDKVYADVGASVAHTETDGLDGADPYANSKSCSELITMCYNRSFFNTEDTAISAARAGNAIGGGDYGENRLIPDCVRALQSGTLMLRRPDAERPYQHVLDVLAAYLTIVKAQYENPALAGSYNVAPDECVTAERLARLFFEYYGETPQITCGTAGFAEAEKLTLDGGKIKTALGFENKYGTEKAVELTARFYKSLAEGINAAELLEKETEQYFCENCE